jgi:hypothetical protein
MQNPTEEKVATVLNGVGQATKDFANELISNDALQAILSNEDYVKKLQKAPVYDSSGNQQGTVLDAEGNLNPLASLEAYQNKIANFKGDLLKTFKATKNTAFSETLSNNLLKMMVRGDGLVPPEVAPTHVVTMNGIFPMSDAYFAELAKSATLEGKPSKDPTTVVNISRYSPRAAEKMSSFKALIEAKAPKQKMPKLEELIVPKDQVDVAGILANAVVHSYDFDFNSSLLPGFTPKDLNTVEFNYVKINGKTTKIPVERNEKIASKLLGEECFVINDILIEAMSNDFVVHALLDCELIDMTEAYVLQRGFVDLLESSEAAQINLETVYNNVTQKIDEDSTKFVKLINILNDLYEKYERDYKMEYRNYHGKAKQRKQRAARTKAREILIKKGVVKKGDGKDIDHKKPLRSGGSKGLNNLRVRDRSDNRSDNGHKKGEKQKKDWK